MGCGEVKMSRKKTASKLKKQDKKQEKIKNDNKRSELGVEGAKSEPASIGHRTNQVGQMTSHTETERGVLTDGYEGGGGEIGEILVSETMNPFTKEEAKRREKRIAAREVLFMRMVCQEKT